MKGMNAGYFSRLDHLRFFAAILVVFFHFSGVHEKITNITNAKDIIKIWASNGSTGVSLFLVLSGFLFCVISSAGSKEIKYKGYITNRILRIAPLVTIFVFICITLNRENSGPLDILRVIFLQLNTGNKWSGWGGDIFPIGTIWTIAVEFQFYLIFPFLMVMLHKHGIRKILLLILFFIMIKFMLVMYSGVYIYGNLYHSIIGRIDQFLVGIVFGALYVRHKNTLMLSRNYIVFIPLTLFALSFLTLLMTQSRYTVIYNSFGFTAEAILWALIIISYLCINININDKIDSVLAYLGGLSFSMYLFHLPIGIIISRFMKNDMDIAINGFVFSIFIVIPITIAVSSLTYSAIEKPFLEMRKKYTSPIVDS